MYLYHCLLDWILCCTQEEKQPTHSTCSMPCAGLLMHTLYKTPCRKLTAFPSAVSWSNSQNTNMVIYIWPHTKHNFIISYGEDTPAVHSLSSDLPEKLWTSPPVWKNMLTGYSSTRLAGFGFGVSFLFSTSSCTVLLWSANTASGWQPWRNGHGVSAFPLYSVLLGACWAHCSCKPTFPTRRGGIWGHCFFR